MRRGIGLAGAVALAVAVLGGFSAGPVWAEEDDLLVRYRGERTGWPAPVLDPGVPYRPLAPLPARPPHPADNPETPAKTALGKVLFFDPRLSRSGRIACVSCHDPKLGWTDGRRKSLGHDQQEGQLNAPSVVNSGYLKEIFWDGRAHSLEEQALASWTDPVEMAADAPAATRRLAAIDGYPARFEAAFGEARLSPQRIQKAIASYMRSVTLTDTPFDRFLRGEADALSDAQVRGLHVFRTQGRCMNCHNGPLLSDGDYHHLGSSFYAMGNFQGRYALSQRAEDVGAFRTAPLRGVTETGPWTSAGLIDDLDDLLAIYNMGWWQNAALDKQIDGIPFSRLSAHIKPLDLDKGQLSDLRAFLDALSGPMPDADPPVLPGRAKPKP